MLKKYLSDIAFMQVLNLLVKPIWILLIDAAVQEALPQGEYGNYFGLYTFSLLFFIILDFGLNSFNATKISRNQENINTLTGSILGFKILLSLIYLVIVFGVGYLAGYTIAEFKLLILLCLIQILTSFIQFFRSIVAGLQRFKWDGVFMVLDRVLLIILCSILLWAGIEGLELTINSFVFAQLIGLSFALLMLLIFLFRYINNVRISFNLEQLKPIIWKSWPFAILISLMGLYNYVDGVMLERMIGDKEAGVYAMGYRFYFALLMFAQVFSGVLLPFFSKNMDNLNVIKSIANYTFKLLFLVGISVALIVWVYGADILQLRFPTKADSHGVDAFKIIMFGFIGSSFILVFGTLLTAALQLKYLNITALITLTVNWLLNWLLIPAHGAVGAAIATAVSQLMFGGICYFLSYHKFQFSLSFKAFFTQVIGVLILCIVILFTKQYIQNFYVHLCMVTISIILVAYLFKLFRVKDLKSLVSK
jgi:O-antigen/teichoic acid export membrane protein